MEDKLLLKISAQGAQETQNAIRGVASASGDASKAFGLLKTAAAALGLGVTAKSFIDAASQAEQYQIRLKVLLRSTEEGSRMFQNMTKYASQVPFEFQNIMGAATTLAGVMKGGVDEVTKWMPLIGDLAAATGLSIEDTTGQVVRMFSAGASAADMFRERGVLSMLGFQSGVTYSADETKQKLMEAWQEPTSKFRGATEQLKDSWTGSLSMMSDAWNQFQRAVMDSGLFDFMKSGINTVTSAINGLNKAVKDYKTANESLFEHMTKGFATGGVVGALLSARDFQTKKDQQKLVNDDLNMNALRDWMGTLPPTWQQIPGGMGPWPSSSSIAKGVSGTFGPDTSDDYKQQVREQAEYNQELARLIYEGREKALADIAKTAEESSKALLDYNEQVSAGISKAMENGRSQNLDYMNQLTKSSQTWFERNTQLIDSWKDRFTNAFMEIGSRGKEAFADMFESIGKDIIRMQIQKGITEPIFAGIGSLFRASGGPVESGRPYIVGEKGPELFVPSKSGTIAPNNALGSSVVVQVIDNRTGNDAPVRVEQSQDSGRTLIRLFIDSAARNVTEGGILAQAIGGTFGLGRVGV